MQPEEALAWQHLFGAGVYFFPILGALVSDVLLGKYRTIIWLSLVYCMGHVVLALNDMHWVHQKYGLALGLALVAIGAGGIKPCVSAHVGDQFGKQNEHLIARAFFWFYFSINLGSAISSWLTPELLASETLKTYKVAPTFAFGLPGVLMFLSVVVFWMGRHKFAHVPPGGMRFLRESLSREGLLALARLIPLYLYMAVFWALYDQSGSSWILQATRMDRVLLGREWLASQIQAVNPVIVMIYIPLFSLALYPLIDRFVVRLTPLRKVSIGFFVTVAAFAVVAWTEMQITGGQVVKSSSDFQPELWSGNRLLDGETGRIGWASGEETQPGTGEPAPVKFPQELVVMLRENREWEIDKVRIHPASQQYRLDADETPSADSPKARAAWAKEIVVSVGPSRKGPWTEVARTTLSQAPEFQTLTLAPVTTRYVRVLILSNYGANAVTLNEIEVHATAAQPPADAHQQALAVWPNVAALGDRPNILWQLLAYLVLTAAEVIVYATCLEFSYTQAPRTMKSFVMGIFLLSVSLGNLLVALVNKVIQNADGSSKLPGASYFWFFTALMLAASIAFIPYARFYKGRTYLQE
jgi:dipeptide/tripeptide permease